MVKWRLENLKKRLSILLINPKGDYVRQNVFPLGLAYIASALSEYDVMGFDLNFQAEETLFEILFNNDFDLVGITVCTDSFLQCLSVSKLVKEVSPNSKIVIGGPHASACYADILLHNLSIDFVSVGDGENTIRLLADQLSSNALDLQSIGGLAYRTVSGEVIYNDFIVENLKNYTPSRDIFIEPPKVAEILGLNEVVANIITSRGCWGLCSFCTIHNRNPKWCSVEISNIEKEIDDLIVIHNVNSLYFCDADFFASRQHAKSILRILRDRNVSFKLSSRADSLLRNRDLLEEAIRIGCNSIEVGIESFSDSQLLRYNKKVTSQTNIDAVKMLKGFQSQYKFTVILEMIMFDPLLSFSELKTNIKTIIDLGFDTPIQEGYLFTKLKLYPDTNYKNMIRNDLSKLDNYFEDSFWCYKDNNIISNYYKYFMAINNMIIPILSEIRSTLRERYNKLKIPDNPNKSIIEKAHTIKMLRELDGIVFKEINDSLDSLDFNSRQSIARFYSMITALKTEVNKTNGTNK